MATGQRLRGRIVVVTGANRAEGIGLAIVRRLLGEGAMVLLHSFPSVDSASVRKCDPAALDTLAAEHPSSRLDRIDADLGDPHSPHRVVQRAVETFGAVDAIVVNHAHSSDQSLDAVTAQELDIAWAVNGRAAILLVQAFAAHHDDDRGNGKIVLFTSGQHLGPMPGEIPYVATKGAVHQITRTLADELADRGIAVNAVNPGPVDTGWASGDRWERIRTAFPAGRWARPEDIAPIVSWLVSPESAWLTGQVLNVEGGFRR